MDNLKQRFHSLLRQSESFFKTDMVYLVSVGFWTNLNIIVTSLGSLLLSIVFANLLPTQVYGIYQYLLSLSGLVGAICLSGMGTAVIQAVARGYEGVFKASVRAQLTWGIVPTTISLGVAIYYFLQGNTEIGYGLIIIGFLTPFLGAMSTYSTFLHGKKEFRMAALFNLIVAGSFYVSMAVGAVLWKNSVALIAINLVVNTGVTAYVYWKTLTIYHPGESIDQEALSYGRHLSVTNAFGTIINQLDSLLVFHFLGAMQLAIYSFATFIPERIGSLLGFIGNGAFPKFANRSLKELRSTIISQTARVALLGGIISLMYAAGAPLLFRLLFPKYIEAIRYTQFYSVVILLFAANLVSSALQAKRLKKEIYIMSLTQPILLMALQVPLLITHGITGMLIARLISDTVAIIFGLGLLMRAEDEESVLV